MTRLNQSRGNNVSHCYFPKSVFLAVALGPFIISGATALFQPFFGVSTVYSKGMEGASRPCFIAITSPPRLLRTGKSPRSPICDALRSQSNEDDGNDDDDDSQSHEGGKSVNADLGALRRRLASQLIYILESQQTRPPNPELGPINFVAAVLNALLYPDDPLPDSGFRVLIRSSTEGWLDLIRNSVGAPRYADEDSIVRALRTAIQRPRNHFGILVGAEDTEKFDITFPSDVVDFEDGACWLECQLRGRHKNELLVVVGWQLKRRKSDGAWLIDNIDWQDFRDGYRPGIGREEWIRICG